jgi:myo-inositol-1(or 4)-monophosphatase
MDYRKYLRIARRAAFAAGRVIKRCQRSGLDVKTKGQHYNLVTAADVASEEKIVAVIRAAFPGHNILAEEKTYGKTDSPFTWVIDPIDGTSNFAHGFPHYGISIGLAHEGEIVVGVVLHPERRELFQAVKGHGAFCNNKPIRTSDAPGLRQSLLVTGFHYERDKKMEKTLSIIGTLLRLGIMDIRRTGSAALDLCYTAAGRVEGFFESRLNPWDFAAGILIVTEAGGRVSSWDGGPLALEASSIAATNGRIQDELLGVLKEDGARRKAPKGKEKAKRDANRRGKPKKRKEKK